MILVRLSDNALFEPISRQKTYEIVAERLLGLISSRHLGPGDAIPSERELVQLYRIRSGGNGSFTVAQFGNPLNNSLDFLLSVDEANYGELFEVRRILEGEAAALAASRHRDEDVVRMAAEIEAMEAALDSEEGFIAADLRFHLTLAEASGNRLIAHLMDAIRSLLQRSLSSAYHIPGSPEGAVVLHGLILEAIAARRPEEARQRMQEHVSRVERDITRSGD